MTTKRRPVRHRERLDYVVPWESRPISKERWEKFRNRMLAEEAAGHRPEEWWLYEQDRDRPENETQVLYTMGELRGAELAKCMGWWRQHYEEANEVLVIGGSFGTIRKTPAQRQEYLDYHDVPRELVKQWDAERTKGTA